MVIEQDLMLRTKTLKRNGMDGGGQETAGGERRKPNVEGAVFSSYVVRTPGKLKLIGQDPEVPKCSLNISYY